MTNQTIQNLTADIIEFAYENDKITLRERGILKMRFDHYTLQEVAEGFDVTRERIRQIEAKAIEKITN